LQGRGIGVLIAQIRICAGNVMLLITTVITFLYLKSSLMMILSLAGGKIKKKKKNLKKHVKGCFQNFNSESLMPTTTNYSRS